MGHAEALKISPVDRNDTGIEHSGKDMQNCYNTRS